MKGIVTDVQRFSLHDGPGIRTTVFLKGCNLNCAWCHNPETIQAKPELLYYGDKCIGCLTCTEVCPTGAQRVVNGKHLFTRDICIHCGRCADVCYPGAAVMAGREIEANDILEEVELDMEYYQRSGGGVTITGGEVLAQKEFTFELLNLCRKKKIHTAIETNMASPWETIKHLLSVTDLVMLDIKHMDDGEHQKWTGKGNHLILENIRRLSKEPVALIARTPVIPGVNDQDEVIRQIGSYISPFPNLLYYELLSFNPFGDSKYGALGIENRFKTAKGTTDERMGALAETASKFGFKVKAS